MQTGQNGKGILFILQVTTTSCTLTHGKMVVINNPYNSLEQHSELVGITMKFILTAVSMVMIVARDLEETSGI